MPVGARPDPPNGVARVAISGDIRTSHWVNVFYLDITHTGDPDPADLATIAEYMGDLWFGNIAGGLSEDAQITQAHLVWYLASGNIAATKFFSSYVGSGGASINDVSACYVVDWTIGASYRGGHPRSYWPGVIQTTVDDGKTVQAATRSGLASDANNFLSAVNVQTAGGITAILMGTVSFQVDNAWRTPPVFRPYLGVSNVYPYVGSQRRRITS
jgi:hypothetical protein